MNELYYLEEIIENYGLAELVDEAQDDERQSLEEAKEYYQLKKTMWKINYTKEYLIYSNVNL